MLARKTLVQTFPLIKIQRSTPRSFLSIMTIMPYNTLALPRWTVQSDWYEVVREFQQGLLPQSASTFWVSVYLLQQPSIHGSIQLVSVNESRNVEVDGGDLFHARLLDAYTLELQVKKEATSNISCLSEPVVIRAPFKTLRKVDYRIHSFDVSPENELLVVGGDDGLIQVYDNNGNLKPRLKLEGHVSDVNTVRFFPSGQVILSGSADMRLKIWSALNGECPMTFVGHRGPIYDSAIISRGRNVLCCKDGTVRLWECASGSCLNVLVEELSAINSIYLSETTTSSVEHSETDHSGKMVVYVTEGGRLGAVDLGSKDVIWTKDLAAGPLKAVSYIPSSHLVASGSETGRISIWDVRHMQEPLLEYRRNEAPITGMMVKGEMLTIASYDGSLHRVRYDSVQSVKLVEDIILDEDPIYALRSSDKRAFGCTRLGNIFEFA